MKKYSIVFVIILLLSVLACSENSKEHNATTNTEEDCTNPTKDPNEVKPMALMMRTMANYCDSMRLDINAGKIVDSTKYPLMPFWKAAPTAQGICPPANSRTPA